MKPIPTPYELGWDGVDEATRMCCNPECRTPIRECMGICHAVDILKAFKGEKTRVRELCGRCACILYFWDGEILTLRGMQESGVTGNCENGWHEWCVIKVCGCECHKTTRVSPATQV